MIFFLYLRFLSSANQDTYYKRYNDSIGSGNFQSENCTLTNTSLQFGYQYNFSLTNCKVSDCHAIIDKTYDLRWGDLSAFSGNRSAFRIVEITGGDVLHKSGIIFRPNQSNVTLILHTQSCHNFYVLHPFEEKAHCETTINISNIIRGLPMCKDL